MSASVARRLRLFLVRTTLVAGIVGCVEGPLAPLPVAAGHYQLASISGLPLPTSGGCGAAPHVASTLLIGADRSASLTVTLANGDSYAAIGHARPYGDGLRLRLRGRWSTMPEAAVTHELQFSAVGAELHRTIGGECDATLFEEYRLVTAY